MERLVIASANKGKIEEIKKIAGSRFEIITMAEAGFTDEIEETGTTFYENAYIKASTIAKKLNENVLADDSGLCVEFLNGAPGVYSARYAGVHGNTKENNLKLLKELEGADNRRAKFCSSVVIVKKDGSVIEGYGETHGTILFKEEGENGFGYDPLFLSDDLNKSFGVASSEEKNKVSHRYRALVDAFNKFGE